MSYADEVFIRNCRDILQNGVWDTDQAVRPRWEDDGNWQTGKTKDLVSDRTCGFKSHLPQE